MKYYTQINWFRSDSEHQISIAEMLAIKDLYGERSKVEGRLRNIFRNLYSGPPTLIVFSGYDLLMTMIFTFSINVIINLRTHG